MSNRWLDGLRRAEVKVKGDAPGRVVVELNAAVVDSIRTWIVEGNVLSFVTVYPATKIVVNFGWGSLDESYVIPANLGQSTVAQVYVFTHGGEVERDVWWTLAHELVHCYTARSNIRGASAMIPHDKDPQEIFADLIAGKVVNYTRVQHNHNIEGGHDGR